MESVIEARREKNTQNNPRHITELKRRNVTHRGETLITIPCWWDGKVER